MHEIVTIQLGQQANYVGTHYWNTQESYFTYSSDEESPIDHDISFRPGVGADGTETFTPRTLIYDLKGAFGSLRRENALYALEQHYDTSRIDAWQSGTVPIQLPRVQPSTYQRALDQGIELPALTPDSVRFWSDFNHVFYHPRSIIQLNDYELNSSLMPFEQWQVGEELFTNLDREHDILDRDLRPFLEECDQAQAIQVMTSTDSAWGGFCSRYLERIADDLGKGCRWVFGFQDTSRTDREQQRRRLANVARSIYAMSSSASMHVPMLNAPSANPPYMSLMTSCKWHTAAMQATALESVMLPTRMRRSLQGHAAFDDLETTLTRDGKRAIASCTFRVQEPDQSTGANEHADAHLTNGYAEDDSDLLSNDERLDIHLYPDIPPAPTGLVHRERRRVHVFGKIECQRNTTPLDSSDEFDQQRQGRTEGLSTWFTQSPLLFPMLSSFPEIFRFPGKHQRLAVDTTLSVSTAISRRIKSLEEVAGRLIGIDEREALCDGLATIAEEYEEGWTSDEDSDDE